MSYFDSVDRVVWGVPVEISVAVKGESAGDQLRDLRRWFADEEELRGLVRLVEEPPKPGSLGGLLDSLVLALPPGAAAMAFASVLIAWIRHRTADTTVEVRRQSDGTEIVKVSSRRVRGLDAHQLRAMVEGLSQAAAVESAETKDLDADGDHVAR